MIARTSLLAAAVLALAMPAYAQMGHNPGQGMPHDPMMPMQDMMQRMHGVMHQAHQMSQAMEEHMRTHNMNAMQQHMAEQHAQAMEQHRMMQRMDECMANMADNLGRTLEEQHRMMQDATLAQDPEMQAHMQELRRHMEPMTEHMQGAVQVLERMNAKLQATAPREKQ